jgi:carbamate kinase
LNDAAPIIPGMRGGQESLASAERRRGVNAAGPVVITAGHGWRGVVTSGPTRRGVERPPRRTAGLEFAAGSMGPKVEAASQFVEATG